MPSSSLVEVGVKVEVGVEVEVGEMVVTYFFRWVGGWRNGD